MKICPKHWSMLRAACTSRGMDHLVHKDGQAAIDSVVRQLEKRDSKRDFDPLMNANWAVTGRAIELCGLSIMEAAEGTDGYCPICIPVKYFGDTYNRNDYPSMETHWVEGVMDAQLEHARELGLMPKAS